MKILHIADIQFEVRNSRKRTQRWDEFKNSLDRFKISIQDKEFDVAVIAGDVFEYYQPNGEEIELFNYLLDILTTPNIKKIIIIPGNHDIKQRSNLIQTEGKNRQVNDHILTTVKIRKQDNIIYYQDSGFYWDDEYHLYWVVWSQKNKHSEDVNSLPYNPWEHQKKPDNIHNKTFVELYHDPISGCKNFTNDKVFQEYQRSLNNFKANLIIAGDIHHPAVYKDNQKFFTYSSSLVPRNMGEGDYYNNQLLVEGNLLHGYNIIDFNQKKNQVNNIDFIQIKPEVARHTVFLLPDKKIRLINPSKRNIINIKIQDKNYWINNREKIIQDILQEYPNTEINETYLKETDISKEESDITFNDLINREKIFEIIQSYISERIESTSILSPEDKESGKKLLTEYFQKEFNKVSLQVDTKEIDLISCNISNFMTFGDNVNILLGKIPITRILGSNKVGKTTLYHFINWMLFDQIDPEQNMNKKKYNYFLYFNDSKVNQKKESVTGIVEVSVNGKIYKIEKILTREFKKNSEYAVDDIKSIGYQLKIYTGEREITGENAENWIKENISNSFDNFRNKTFFNQSQLENLIKQNPESLALRILDDIGLNIFDQLGDNFPILKGNILNKLTKHPETIQEIISLKQGLEKKNQEIVDQQEKINSEIQENQEKIKIQEDEIQEKSQEIDWGINIESLEKELDDNKENIKRINQFILQEKEKLQKFENQVEKEKEVTNKLHEIKLIIEKKNLSLENLKEKEKNLLQKIENKKQEIKNEKQSEINLLHQKLNETRSFKQEDVDTVSSEIDVINEKREKINHDINYSKDKYKDKKNSIETVIIKIETDIKNIQDSISNHQDSIIKFNEKIEKIKNSDRCQLCGQKIDNQEHREHQENQISELRKEIQEKENIIQNSKKTIKEISNNISSYKSELENLNGVFQEKKSKLKQESEKLSDRIIQLHGKKESIKREYTKKENKIETEIQELKEKIKTSFIQELDKLGIKEELTDLKNTIEETEKEIPEYKEKKERLIEIKERFTEIKERIKLINQKISEKEDDVKGLEFKQESIQEKLTKGKNQESKKELLKSKKNILETSKQEKDELIKRYYNLNQEISNNTQKIKDLVKKSNDIKEYDIKSSVLKLYKSMLGKNGLPKHLFSYISKLINQELNTLLKNLDFTIQFQDFNLILIDHKENTSRPVFFTSGMESSLLGLSLVYAIKTLSNNFRYGFILIDEISGKLNDGKNLSYDAPNFKEIFKEIINLMSQQFSIYIVEHVIEDLGENRTIEVIGENGGSIIKTR